MTDRLRDLAIFAAKMTKMTPVFYPISLMSFVASTYSSVTIPDEGKLKTATMNRLFVLFVSWLSFANIYES